MSSLFNMMSNVVASVADQAMGGPPPHVRINPDDVLFEGWCNKESHYLKEMRKRYMVLTAKYLCSFKDQNYKGEQPTEVIVLKQCSTVKSEEGSGNAFIVQMNDRTFRFMVEGEKEKEAWIGAIGRSMVRPEEVFEEEYI